jgi:hypothetical protein
MAFAAFTSWARVAANNRSVTMSDWLGACLSVIASGQKAPLPALASSRRKPTMLRPEEIYAILTLMRGASLLLALVFALKIVKHFVLTL